MNTLSPGVLLFAVRQLVWRFTVPPAAFLVFAVLPCHASSMPREARFTLPRRLASPLRVRTADMAKCREANAPPGDGSCTTLCHQWMVLA